MSEVTETELAAKAVAPRITQADVDAAACFNPAQYHVFEGSCLTVCVITLPNGFTVTGESACASPENFNAEIGARLAYSQAKNKIWPLLGYSLREQLHQAEVDKAEAEFVAAIG